jgi:hypothetical protein
MYVLDFLHDQVNLRYVKMFNLGVSVNHKVDTLRL